MQNDEHINTYTYGIGIWIVGVKLNDTSVESKYKFEVDLMRIDDVTISTG